MLRIGVNVGDVIVERSDLYGDGVNIATRLEPLADPGHVVVSGTVFNHVRGKVKLGFDDLGERQLRNIAEPVRTYRVRPDSEDSVAGPALTLPDKPSIAVLPFQNMSGDPEQEFFSDGVTEDIITTLSGFARSSSSPGIRASSIRGAPRTSSRSARISASAMCSKARSAGMVDGCALRHS